MFIEKISSFLKKTFRSGLILQKDKLPKDLKTDSVIRALDNQIIQLDQNFTQQGYVVANINRLSALTSRINQFEKIKDKSGRIFFETILKS